MGGTGKRYVVNRRSGIEGTIREKEPKRKHNEDGDIVKTKEKSVE